MCMEMEVKDDYLGTAIFSDEATFHKEGIAK
jgi:hypothetical protein